MRPKKKGHSFPLVLLGGLLVVVLAYYCAGGMHPGETIFEWQERMKNILDHPFAWYWNAYTWKTAFGFLLVYALAVMMHFAGRRNYLPGREMGSAQYADVKKVNQRLADLSMDAQDPKNIAVIKKRWRGR